MNKHTPIFPKKTERTSLLVYECLWTSRQSACSLVGVGAGLGWLVLVFCKRKTLLAGWFGLAETNKRTC